MIPIEKISGGTLSNIVLYVSIVGLLLVVASFIRLKVPLLRKAFIPASLLAGIIGLILGPYALKIIPADMMSSIGALPTPMITVVFACMLLGVENLEKQCFTTLPPVLAGFGQTVLCSSALHAFFALFSFVQY